MSAAFRKWFIHTCTLQAFDGTRLPTGEYDKATDANWDAVATEVDCRFFARRERYASETLGLQIATEYGMLFPTGTTLTNQYRVTTIVRKKDGVVVSSDKWEILEVLPRNSRKERFISTSLELVK